MMPKRANAATPHENEGKCAVIAMARSEGRMLCGREIDLALLIQKRILFIYLQDSMYDINASFIKRIPPGVGKSPEKYQSPL